MQQYIRKPQMYDQTQQPLKNGFLIPLHAFVQPRSKFIQATSVHEGANKVDTKAMMSAMAPPWTPSSNRPHMPDFKCLYIADLDPFYDTSEKIREKLSGLRLIQEIDRVDVFDSPCAEPRSPTSIAENGPRGSNRGPSPFHHGQMDDKRIPKRSALIHVKTWCETLLTRDMAKSMKEVGYYCLSVSPTEIWILNEYRYKPNIFFQDGSRQFLSFLCKGYEALRKKAISDHEKMEHLIQENISTKNALEEMKQEMAKMREILLQSFKMQQTTDHHPDDDMSSVSLTTFVDVSDFLPVGGNEEEDDENEKEKEEDDNKTLLSSSTSDQIEQLCRELQGLIPLSSSSPSSHDYMQQFDNFSEITFQPNSNSDYIRSPSSPSTTLSFSDDSLVSTTGATIAAESTIDPSLAALSTSTSKKKKKNGFYSSSRSSPEKQWTHIEIDHNNHNHNHNNQTPSSPSSASPSADQSQSPTTKIHKKKKFYYPPHHNRTTK